MLQQDEPDDYVIATGECYSVKQFLEAAFKCVDIDPYEYLETDQTFFRPSEVFLLQGDATKAGQKFGWKNKLSFQDLVNEMVESDLRFYEKTLANKK